MATPRPQRSLLLILGMIATVLLGWVLHVGADIIQPLVIALLLGSMLQPVVSWLAQSSFHDSNGSSYHRRRTYGPVYSL